MQRLLRQVVTPSGNTRRIFHSHSLPNPLPPHISASSLNPPLHPFHPWLSEYTVSGIFRGFHSGPVFARHFMFSSSNTLLRTSNGSAQGFGPKLLRAQFHGKNFDVNRSFRYYSGGWRSWFKGLTTNDIILGLIIANVVVFLSWRIASEKFMSENFTISLHNINCGRLHTLITNAFSHIDKEHIISNNSVWIARWENGHRFRGSLCERKSVSVNAPIVQTGKTNGANMIGLYFFGTSIGSAFGPEYLLKLFLAGALGGSVFYLVHQAYKALTSKDWGRVEVSKHQALGASGAVNAIMLLKIFLFPRSTIYFNFFIPVPAILVGIFLIGNDVLKIIEGDGRISGSAHLGGAAVAAIAWARIRKGRF